MPSTVRAGLRRDIGRATYLRKSGLPILAGEAEPSRFGSRLAARPGPELAQDRRHVVVDGLPRHDQSLRDLAVAQALRHEREHLLLACRQPGRILPGRRPGPAREPAY